MTLNAATLRQVLAVLVSVYGVLTSTVNGIKLPAAVSAVLVAFAPVMLVVQHYLADPSTGTPTPPPVPTPVATVTTSLPPPA